MPLGNVSAVVVRQRGGRCLCDLKKQVHAVRKVCPEDESAAGFLDGSPDAIEFAVPAGGSDDHGVALTQAGLDVRHHGLWPSEVNHHVEVEQMLVREPCSVLVDVG